MKRILLLILTLISTPVFAAAPDVRISDNDSQVLNLDSNGRVGRAPYSTLTSSFDRVGAASTATQLSANSSAACSEVRLCASKDNAGIVAWGGSTVHWNNGPGVRLGGEARASCDTVLVDNVQDIYVSAQTAGDTVNYNYLT